MAKSHWIEELVDFFWPVTIAIGVIMAIAAIAFVTLMFLIVYGLLFSGRWLEIGSG